MRHILKVQTDMTKESVLFYNEDRSFIGTLSDPAAVEATADELGMGPMEKRFVIADVGKDGTVEIVKRVEMQDW